MKGFPGSSAGEESACNAGNWVWFLGREDSLRRGRLSSPVFLGFPSGWDGKESACNARDLGLIPGWEDPLEEGMATHSSVLAWRIPMDRGAWWATVHGVTKSDMTEWLSTAQHSTSLDEPNKVYSVIHTIKYLRNSNNMDKEALT